MDASLLAPCFTLDEGVMGEEEEEAGRKLPTCVKEKVYSNRLGYGSSTVTFSSGRVVSAAAGAAALSCDRISGVQVKTVSLLFPNL